MRRIHVAAEAISSAPAAIVFNLLKDGATWPAWSSFDSCLLERPGREEPYGVGAIRVLTTKVSRAREEIVELVPDRKQSYVLLSGFPFREYRAEVELGPAPGGGTLITWRAAFTPKHFGTGWLWRIFIAAVLASVAKQLASAAERKAAV